MQIPAQEALSADILVLGGLLGGAILRLAGEEAFDLVEEVRASAKRLRESPSVDEARKLRDRLDLLGLPALRALIRAFSVYFDLINLTEQRARVRALRARALKAEAKAHAETPEAALRQLRERGIAAGVHYPLALCDQPALAMLHGADMPVARDWAARELSLPIFPEMTGEEQDAVVAAVGACAGAAQ